MTAVTTCPPATASIMTTDFIITSWGPYLLVTAQSTRAVAWLADHWCDPAEPPQARATKVDRLLSEVCWWWANYEPTYTYEFGDDTAKNRLSISGRIT